MITTILASQLDNVGSEPIFIVTALRNLALGRTVLTKCPAGATLTDAKRLPDMINT